LLSSIPIPFHFPGEIGVRGFEGEEQVSAMATVTWKKRPYRGRRRRPACRPFSWPSPSTKSRQRARRRRVGRTRSRRSCANRKGATWDDARCCCSGYCSDLSGRRRQLQQRSDTSSLTAPTAASGLVRLGRRHSSFLVTTDRDHRRQSHPRKNNYTSNTRRRRFQAMAVRGVGAALEAWSQQPRLEL
jgi:hypothetical protein